MRTTIRRRVACLLAGLAVALGGCGGGGGGSPASSTSDVPSSAGSAQPGADYFPLGAGAVWLYDSSTDGAYTSRATGTRSVGGRTLYGVTDSGASRNADTQYERTAAGVVELPATGADPLDVALADIPILPQGLVAGQTTVPLNRDGLSTSDLDGDGKPEQVRVRAEQTVVGFETIATVAGTFTRAAHIRTVATETITPSRGTEPVTVVTTLDAWFAPDVGLVKATAVTQAGTQSLTDRTELQAYGVGALRSEFVAPTISARQPAAAATTTSASVQVSFSEAMDRYGDAQALITLTGPAGTPVAGTASWLDERTLRFSPTAVPASGGYTVTLSASLQDRVTNPLAGTRSWSFTVDREPPVVTAVSPADGSVEVALNAAVQIDFAESLDADSVTSSTVRLSTPTGLVNSSVTLVGKRVTVVPTAPLPSATFITLEISGVKDLAGNPVLSSIPSRFRTDNGRLALPVPLPPGLATVSAARAADMDGDGRTDLVVLGLAVNPGPGALYLYRSLADGTLTGPARLPVQSSCGVMEAWPADANGDGRTDLLVSTTCGIEVQLRDARGALQPRAFLPVSSGATQTRTWRSAGLPGIATVPLDAYAASPTPRVQLWSQTSSGVYAAQAPITPLLKSLYDLRVADVDGDGRDDLILWGLLSSGQESGVEIRLQRADGTFASGREMAVPYCGGNHDLAIGDVTGDGRPDFVLMTGPCGGADARVVVMPQATDGSFGPATTLASAANLALLALADMDGDRRLDIVALHDSLGVGIYLQQADGRMGSETLYSGSVSSRVLIVADLTGDGRPDVMTDSGLMRQKAAASGTAQASRSASLRALLKAALAH